MKKNPPDFKEVFRLTVASGEMQKKTVIKNKFLQINKKRFYFPDRILSLPFYHPSLKELNEFKGKKGQRIEKYFWDKKEKLLKIAKRELKSNSQLYLYHQVLMTEPKVFNINCKGNFNQ